MDSLIWKELEVVLFQGLTVIKCIAKYFFHALYWVCIHFRWNFMKQHLGNNCSNLEFQVVCKPIPLPLYNFYQTCGDIKQTNKQLFLNLTSLCRGGFVVSTHCHQSPPPIFPLMQSVQLSAVPTSFLKTALVRIINEHHGKFST